MKVVDFIIVGQGLAGTILAWELMQRGKTIAVFDEGTTITSSKIAAGMFNPINTKRFTVSNNAEQQIQEALNVYRQIENTLQVNLIHETPIYYIFGSVKESNDFSLKADHPFFKKYTNVNPTPETNIHNAFGAFEVLISGWIDIPKLLASVRSYILLQQHYVQQKFEYAALENKHALWNYGMFTSRNIVFCEGIFARENLYFKGLNIIPCKGDVIEFFAPDLKIERVVKKGIYIVPLGKHNYRCGSTYKWENDSTNLLATDYEELKTKIEALIKVPFTITSHQTAIRPTTKNREPFWLKHPQWNNMYTINGLGTKGVLNGVSIIRQFISTLQ